MRSELPFASRLGDVAAVILIAFAACSGTTQEPGKPTNAQLQSVAAEALSAEADRPRQEMVRQELGRSVDQVLSFSARNLGARDQQLLAKLLEATQVVDELDLLQAHPRMLEYRSKVQQDGTDDDRRLFARNHGPWCLETDDVRCNALRQQPPRGSGVWPPDLTAAEFARLATDSARLALLSPFTVVERAGAGFRALPLVQSPVLGSRIKQLSRLLAEAATLAEEPSLKRFLSTRSTALLSSSPFPFDDSDLDGIAVSGRWEVMVGPYETARDPRGVKARLAIWIGLEDTAVSEQLAAQRAQLQPMEATLARVLGRRVYKERTINPLTVVRAVQLVVAAGDARLPRGALVALQLPTIGKAVAKGLSKKIIFVNQLRSYTPVMQTRAKLVLAADQDEHVQEEAGILNATFHELCHSLGAYDALEIKGAQGPTTVAKALGDLAPTMEELKALVLSLWLPTEQRKPKAAEAALRQRSTTALVQLLSQLTHDPDRPEIQAAAVLVGALIDAKVLKHDDVNNRFSLVYRTLPRALRDLTKRVATIQLTGDRDAAASLIGTYVEKKAQGPTLVDRLFRARMRLREVFGQAGIKPVSLSYKVTDLAPPSVVTPIVVTPPTPPTVATPALKAPAKKDGTQPPALKAPARKDGTQPPAAKKDSAKVDKKAKPAEKNAPATPEAEAESQ
jgi:hypothetical protein